MEEFFRDFGVAVWAVWGWVLAALALVGWTVWDGRKRKKE